jgi:hypothetical protein
MIPYKIRPQVSFWVLAAFLWTRLLPAQTEQPVRLAIISQSADSVAAADLLTAELSGNKRVQLGWGLAYNAETEAMNRFLGECRPD